MRLVHDPLAATNVPPTFDAPAVIARPVSAIAKARLAPAASLASYRACSEPLPGGGECLRRAAHHGDHRPSLRRSVAADQRFQLAQS